MSFTRQVEAAPGKIAEALAELERPDRKAEAEQLAALANVVEDLVPVVSGRERVLVTLQGHSDRDADGFDPRSVSLTISRVDPEATAQREEAERHARELREAQEAAERAGADDAGE